MFDAFLKPVPWRNLHAKMLPVQSLTVWVARQLAAFLDAVLYSNLNISEKVCFWLNG